VSALVTPTHIIVANCGDSRCVLVRAGKAVDMSIDHKPYLEAEQRRIEHAGGTVTMRRVNGDLAVSRALGDYVYKQVHDLPARAQQVSAEPEIMTEARTGDDQVRPPHPIITGGHDLSLLSNPHHRYAPPVISIADAGAGVRRRVGRDEQPGGGHLPAG